MSTNPPHFYCPEHIFDGMDKCGSWCFHTRENFAAASHALAAYWYSQQRKAYEYQLAQRLTGEALHRNAA